MYYINVEHNSELAIAAAERALRNAPRDEDALLIAAQAENIHGRPERALAHVDAARRLDPLSSRIADRRQLTLLSLRRFDDVLGDAQRVLDLDPTNLDALENGAMAHVGRGDLAAARKWIRRASPRIDQKVLVAYFGLYWDMYWVLDDEQQKLLLTLPQSYFDDNRAAWALLRAQLHAHRGNLATARAWGDTAQLAYAELEQRARLGFSTSIYKALAMAYAGRSDEAVSAAEGAFQAGTPRGSLGLGYFELQLARIYMLAGRLDKAVDQLEIVLRMPNYVSPGWLRVDPNFDPLRNHPRFQRLANKGRTS